VIVDQAVHRDPLDDRGRGVIIGQRQIRVAAEDAERMAALRQALRQVVRIYFHTPQPHRRITIRNLKNIHYKGRLRVLKSNAKVENRGSALRNVVIQKRIMR